MSRAHWVWLLFAGTVSRADWVTRNSETYGQNRLVAHVLFDYLDSNNDLLLNNVDVRQILLWADVNREIFTFLRVLFLVVVMVM